MIRDRPSQPKRPTKKQKTTAKTKRQPNEFVYRLPPTRHARVSLLVIEEILSKGQKPSDQDLATLLEELAGLEQNNLVLSSTVLLWLAARIRKQRYTARGVRFAEAITAIEIVHFIDRKKRELRRAGAKATYFPSVIMASQEFTMSTDKIKAIYTARKLASDYD